MHEMDMFMHAGTGLADHYFYLGSKHSLPDLIFPTVPGTHDVV